MVPELSCGKSQALHFAHATDKPQVSNVVMGLRVFFFFFLVRLMLVSMSPSSCLSKHLIGPSKRNLRDSDRGRLGMREIAGLASMPWTQSGVISGSFPQE